MNKIILKIEGMTCSACSNGLEKYLNKQKGIQEAKVNLVLQNAEITYDENLTIEKIEKFISEAGFTSLGIENYDLGEEKTSLTRELIYGILGLILMYISMAHMLKLPIIEIYNPIKNPIVYSVTLLVLTIPFLYYGFDIITSGVKNLIHKMPNMDTLVTIGIISSFLYSLFSVIMIINNNISYIHSLYFESTAFVIYFIKLGRYIDKKSKSKTKEAIRGLVKITPEKARLKKDNTYIDITIDEVKKDDILICLPGDRVAADGEVIEGHTHLDETFITGESIPVEKKVHDKVIAGSINYESTFTYKAERIGKDSTISEIVRLVVEATNTKAPISKLADKICGIFVPTVIVIAILTLIGNLLLTNDIQTSIIHFITVLVVACPCSLGLATPLAMVVALGNSARNGILIKNNEILETINDIDTVIFDKTGTLTNGILSINIINNHCDLEDTTILEILSSIEKNSSHPLAKGIVNYAKDHKINFNLDLTIEDLPGYGVKAKDNSNVYYACNASLLEKLDIINSYKEEEQAMARAGNSIIYLVKNNKVIATFGLKDTVRKESKKVVETLKSKKLEVVMLSGDNQLTAEKIAKELGIEQVFSNMLPKDKTKYIKDLLAAGKKVIMVGDGINDAPSLSSATIGISLKGATDIATSSADVIIMNNLQKITTLFNIGKRTLKNIKQNLFWAFAYNIIMIPLAMGIFKKINITPMIACLAMILSSLTVTINALRLKKISKVV